MSLGVAVLGFGSFGHIHSHNLLSLKDQFKVVGIHKRSTSSDLPAPYLADFETDVLGNPEVESVLVTSPDPTHEEYTRRALEAGKHVFVEKPISLSSEGTKKLIDLANAKNLRLEVGFQRRHDESHLTFFKEFSQAMETGKVDGKDGVKLTSLEIVSKDPCPYEPEEHDFKLVAFQSMVHDVDTIVWMMDKYASNFEMSEATMADEGGIMTWRLVVKATLKEEYKGKGWIKEEEGGVFRCTVLYQKQCKTYINQVRLHYEEEKEKTTSFFLGGLDFPGTPFFGAYEAAYVEELRHFHSLSCPPPARLLEQYLLVTQLLERSVSLAVSK